MNRKLWLIGMGSANILCLVMQVFQSKKQKRELHELGDCHNTFVHMQEEWNQSTEEQLLSIQDEISTVYSHMDKLLESMGEQPYGKEL